MDKLEKIAKKIRINIIKMLNLAGSGHPGGSLSATDIVVALYTNFLKHDPKNPLMKDRDRFVLSKGHAAPLLYAMLAHEGYFKESELWTLRKTNSRLQGHPVIQTVEHKAPGVEFTTGPLGQGF